MRYVDTNVFVDALVDQGTTTRQRSLALLSRVRAGDEEVGTTELVLSELVFFLRTARAGKLPVDEVARAVTSLIRIPSLRVPNKGVWLRALELMAEFRVDLPDAYVAATMEFTHEAEVYALDSDFDRIPGVKRIEP